MTFYDKGNANCKQGGQTYEGICVVLESTQVKDLIGETGPVEVELSLPDVKKTIALSSITNTTMMGKYQMCENAFR